MSTVAAQESSSVAQAEETERSVSNLELFFDLVFVFAVTQVTELMADKPTFAGMGEGLLVLGVLWWAWVGYSWLGTQVEADSDGSRLVFFVAMGAMLVASLAVPEAFGAHAGLFAGAYAVVRGAQIVALVVAPTEPSVRRAGRLLAPTIVVAGILLAIASGTDGTTQALLWVAALSIDLAGPLFTRGRGWTVAAEHFSERHGLVVIIALGESIVAIGAGAESELGRGEVTAAVLGVAIACALWWMYFDVVAIVAGRKLASLHGTARNRLARDSYSYDHLLFVAGIVLVALGLKKTLGHVEEPLKDAPAVALCGGTALYLMAHLLFRKRNMGTWSPRRFVTMVLCLALIPVAREVDALVSVALIAVLTCGLVVYEAVRYREPRMRLRAGLHH